MANLIGTGSNVNVTCYPANTSVVIAADGTALVVWYDGTNQNYAYAEPPYTSWTSNVLLTGSRFTASAALDTSDNAWIIANDTTNGITYYPLTKNGATYTLGTPVIVSSTQATTGFGSPMMTVKDPQGRYWTISNDDTTTHAITFDTATPATAGWAAGLSASGVGTALQPCADIVGDYLVVLWFTDYTHISYTRLDVSQITLGSWSTPVSVFLPSGLDTPGSFRGNDSGQGIFAYRGKPGISGIQTMVYTAADDTWASEVTLSSTSNDAMATLVQAQHDIYCIWRQDWGSPIFALVYKKWAGDTQTWDQFATTLVPPAKAVDKPQAAYGNGIIGVAYEKGTAVYFETFDVNPLDPALSVYGTSVAATTVATADTLAQIPGGTETFLRTTAPASGTSLYMEALSQGGTGTTNASIPAQSGNGWLLDSTLLERERILAGSWTDAIALRNTTGAKTLTSVTLRFSKRSGAGVYTTIGSLSLSNVAVTTSRQVFSLGTASLPKMDFGIGDKLYLDLFYQSGTAANAWASDQMDVFVSSVLNRGITNDLQVATPGTVPLTTLGTDTFLTGGRGAPNAWSPGSSGDSWTVGSGTDTLSFTGTAGVMTFASSTPTTALYTSLIIADQEVLVNVTQNTAATDPAGALCCFQDANNYYFAVIGNTGTTFEVRRNLAGVFTTIGSASFTPTVGTKYSIRFNILGTTLKAKVWQSNQAEPVLWTIPAFTDSTITQGQFGVIGTPLVSSAHTVSFDTFQATIAVIQTHAGYAPRYVSRSLSAVVHQPIQPVNVPRYVVRGLMSTLATYTNNIVARFGLALLKEVATRLRIRSADTARDLFTRFHLGRLRDALARFRLRSADQLRESATRFRQRSPDQLKNLSSRILQRSADLKKDSAARFIQRSANQLKDLVSRVRLMSASQFKDLTTRLRQRSADQVRDGASRLRLSLLRDIVMRFRLSLLKDTAARFRQRSANQLKDGISRFRQRSPDQLKDISTRLLVMSVGVLHDGMTRLRLMSANQLKDLSSRIRLRSADQFRNAISRLLLRSANRLLDLSTRFIQRSLDQLRHTATRVRMRSADQFRDTFTRFRQRSLDQLKDLSSRLRLARLFDLTTRLRLKSGDVLKDMAGRVRLMSASQFKDMAGHVRVRSADLVQNGMTRFRLAAAIGRVKDSAARFRLRSPDQLKDTATRLRQRSADQLKDLRTRFLVMSVSLLHDGMTRLRLRSADQLRDLRARIRLATFVNVASRFRLAVLKVLGARLRIRSADVGRSMQARLLVMSASQVRDALTRLRLRSANTLRDGAARFQVSLFRDTLTRFGLALSRDGVARLSLKSQETFHDLMSRLKVRSADHFTDFLTRFRLRSSASLHDGVMRLLVVNPYREKELICRFVLAPFFLERALLSVRSGDGNIMVRSGDGNLSVRSGDGSIMVRSGETALTI